jgi:hypothetical protein
MDQSEVIQCMDATERRLTEMLASLTEEMKLLRTRLEASDFICSYCLKLQDFGDGPDIATMHRTGAQVERQVRRDHLWFQSGLRWSKPEPNICLGNGRFSTSNLLAVPAPHTFQVPLNGPTDFLLCSGSGLIQKFKGHEWVQCRSPRHGA